MRNVPDRDFWEGRLPDWDASRYRRRLDPVARRSRLAALWLADHGLDRSIVDLGCGSGRLLAELQALGAARLTGLDWSEWAVSQARRRCPEARILCQDLTREELPHGDVYVGLGLLDWIDARDLMQRLAGRHFLFSFSRADRPFLKAMHRLFSGWKPRFYSPRQLGAPPLHLAWGGGLVGFVATFPLSPFTPLAEGYRQASQRGLWGWIRSQEKRAVGGVLPPLEGRRVLEMAAGAGYYTDWLAGFRPQELVAVDSSRAMLRQIQAPEVERIVADRPPPDRKFDVVACLGGLEFLPDSQVWWRWCEQATRPGGQMVALVPRNPLYVAAQRARGLPATMPRLQTPPGFRLEKRAAAGPLAEVLRWSR